MWYGSGMGEAARDIRPGSRVLRLRDGATAADVGGALELRDDGGRLLVRYEDGNAEIFAPGGDLTLAAPGKLLLRSGSDVCIDAPRRLEITADLADLKVSQVRVVAQRVATAVTAVAHRVEHYELTAERLVERARDAFRDVSGTFQARLGRSRTIVEDVNATHARRQVITSEQDTTIDGERILLG